MIDPFTIGLILSGGGAILNAIGGSKERGQQRRQFNDIRSLLGTQLGGDAFSVEDLITQRLGSQGGNSFVPDLSFLTSASDPILQSIRRGPNDAFLGSNLQELGATGNPFDVTQIIDTLTPLRDRSRGDALADLRSGAPGLGARFGSATARGEEDLIAQLQEQNNAIDSQLLFQGHESAQGRRLQALNGLLGLDAQSLDRDRTALDFLLGRAGAETDAGRLGLAGQAQDDSLLNLLLQAQSTRRGQGIQSAGVLAGVSVPGSNFSSAGGAALDFSQLLLLSELFKSGDSATP